MSYPGITVDDRMTFRGDALEVLTEYLMKVLSLANNTGLCNYEVVPARDDYGVDAVGVKNEVNVAVQCKFRSNPKNLVHYSDLAKTFTRGVIKHNVDPGGKKNIWLVTTANDANHISKEVLGKRLHVVGYGFFSKNLDGNHDFWQGLRASI